MDLVFIITGIVLIAATILSVSLNESWWVRIFDFPRLQIFCLLVVIAGFYPYLYGLDSDSEVIFYALLIISMAYQLGRIYPYTVLAGVESENAGSSHDTTKIRILVANILMTNRRTADFLKLVERYDPDVICVLEPDNIWSDSLECLEEVYAYSVKHPRNDTYGMIVLSRLELIEPSLRFIVEDHVPSVYSKIKLRSGDIIEFYCLHPSPPNPRYAEETTERDAELVIVGRECSKSEYPCIVTGDLNDVAWSYTTRLFQKVSKLLDPRKGRGFFNTFHAGIPFLRFPLDHMFHSVSFKLLRFEKLDNTGSDHFPIFVELNYDRNNKQSYNGPLPDDQDIQVANEKVKDAT